MSWKQKLTLGVQALFRKGELDTDMGLEMRSHVEMQAQENYRHSTVRARSVENRIALGPGCRA